MNRQCQFCGGPLYGRSDKRYCSSKCRRDASRLRQRAPTPDPPDGKQAQLQSSPINERDARFLLGGVEVDERLVRDLISILPDRPLARKLDTALLLRARFVGLSSDERRAVLAGLEHGQGDLRDLRETLLTDPYWRRWELSTET